jgi:glutamate-1-semialdehyde 2,1-aminomutase
MVFAVAALTVKKEIMQIGGILTEGAERVFLTSTTHGAEMSALGAFLKTVEILDRDKVIDHFWNYGQRLISGVNNICKEFWYSGTVFHGRLCLFSKLYYAG